MMNVPMAAMIPPGIDFIGDSAIVQKARKAQIRDEITHVTSVVMFFGMPIKAVLTFSQLCRRIFSESPFPREAVVELAKRRAHPNTHQC